MSGSRLIFGSNPKGNGCFLWSVIALLVLLLPAGGAPYTGAKICGTCHPAQFSRQSSSAHAAALFRTRDHPLAPSFPLGGTPVHRTGYKFEFFRSAGQLWTRISDTGNVMDLPVEWAFGAGRQAVTFVTRVDKNWYVEHYLSYYSALRSYEPTPGQEAIRPTSVPEAAGLMYKISDPNTGIAGCFECHSTGPVSFAADGEATPGELGVRCESCHGSGAAHVKKASRTTIGNPATLSASELNEFCGRCHRPPAAKGIAIDWNHSWNVRHQPVYLNESACFRKSAGALSCLTCHNPHDGSDRKEAGYYNGRCVACHSASSRPPKPVCEKRTPANCIDCHMPLVSPQPPLRFTNHWIGIYRDGARLKPAR